MALDRYVINHGLLIRMQRSGNVFCEVCHKPIVEGQVVYWIKRSGVIHADCAIAPRQLTS
jgi:hypothetical protein